MRLPGSAVAALLGLLLASCAVTPPVLGGRTTDAPAPGELTDEDVAALLIRDDPESENVVLALEDYRAGADAAACPGLPLLVPDEPPVDGSVVLSPPLFLEASGADLLVAQAARLFGSPTEATSFLAALRLARAACPGLEIVDGEFTVEATGFATAGAGATSFEWVLVDANVALSVAADVRDQDDAERLRALAAEYAAALATD